MLEPRIFGVIAVAALTVASVAGYPALRKDTVLRNAIAALMFCALAALATSFTRNPAVIWPLAAFMLAAMAFLVWTMQREVRRKQSTARAGKMPED
jgi:4-hydroxybenzoate polyprenyltransferase